MKDKLYKELQSIINEYQKEHNIDKDKLYNLYFDISSKDTDVIGSYNPYTKCITLFTHSIELFVKDILEVSYINTEETFDNCFSLMLTNTLKHELAHHIDYITRYTSDHSKIFKDICKDLNILDSRATVKHNSIIFKQGVQNAINK